MCDWVKACFSWTGIAAWKWIANDTECGICRMPFDGCCPDCKIPGDDCALGKVITHISMVIQYHV